MATLLTDPGSKQDKVTVPETPYDVAEDIDTTIGDAREEVANTDTTVTADYEGPEISAEDAPEQVVSDESLVQNQLSSLLSDPENPYMQTVDNMAQQQAGEYGLLSQGGAIAGMGLAKIRGGMDIAKLDAATYADADRTRQRGQTEAYLEGVAGEVQGSMASQQANLDTAKTKFQADIDLIKAGADLKTQAMIDKFQKETSYVIDDTLTKLDYKLQENRDNQSIDAQTEASLREGVNSMLTEHYLSVGALWQNTDFLQLPADVQVKRINQITNLTKANVYGLHAAYTSPVPASTTKQLNNLYMTYKWIGQDGKEKSSMLGVDYNIKL